MAETISQINKTVHFVSLGCEKNLVDSQVMLGHMGLDGFRVVEDPAEASAIVVNTCSFIEASKKESIDTILDLADYKDPANGNCEALVVSGCMAQRYADQLEAEMSEIDLIIGTGEYHRIVPLLKALNEGKLDKKSHVEIPKFIHTEFDPRLNTSPGYMAWLKISEGCNRNCTFCIIPTIRGRLRSRTVESLVAEAKNLAENGVKEFNLISQDLSDYGVDLDDKHNLFELLRGLEEVEGIEWIRLYYFYPDELTDEVIDLMAKSKKICRYLDMPVQHFSDHILRKMNRKITGEKILERVQKLRQEIPDIVIRTSIIVGFPTERDEDFQKLMDGVEQARFNHLGIFRYSDEEGTPAFKINPKVHQDVIEDRFDELFELQREIATEHNQAYLGKEIEVLIEGEHEETELLIKGRHRGQAPDVDGSVLINETNGKEFRVGDIVKARVTEVLDFDVVAEII